MTKRVGRHDIDTEEVTPYGPIDLPVSRFAHLPEPTRKWLEDLREDDLNAIREAAQMLHAARIIGRFGKWVLGTILAALLMGVAAGEAMQKLFTMIVRGGHH